MSSTRKSVTSVGIKALGVSAGQSDTSETFIAMAPKVMHKKMLNNATMTISALINFWCSRCDKIFFPIP